MTDPTPAPANSGPFATEIALIMGIVNAAGGALVAFGIPYTDPQQHSIATLVYLFLLLISAIIVRANVFSKATVRRLYELKPSVRGTVIGRELE